MRILCTLMALLLQALPASADAGLHGWDALKNKPDTIKRLAAEMAPQEFGSRGWDALKDKSVTLVKAMAAKGDAAAQCSLAERLLKGIDTKADAKAALHWFELSAARKFPPAQMRLGDLYTAGDVVAEDRQAAKRYYEAAQGYPPAEFKLGSLYLWDKSTGGLGDSKKGLALCKHAAEAGSGSATEFLGDLFRNGSNSVKKDLQESRNWYRLGAHLGNDYCSERLAECYFNGTFGVKQDIREAVVFFAMNKKSAESRRWYKLLHSKNTVTDSELRQARKWMLTSHNESLRSTANEWDVLHVK